MKKLLSVLLVCSIMFTGLSVTFVSASGNESVEFTYSSFETMIRLLVGSLQNIQDRDERAAQFKWYLNTIGKHDSEIESLISQLDGSSPLTDNMLAVLEAGAMDKEQMKFMLQVIQSFPEAERSEAVEEFYENQKNGANYEFADPNSDKYNEKLVNAYKDLYNKYINSAFQKTVLDDYGLEYIDFVPFIRVVTNNIYFTRSSDGKIAIMWMKDSFDKALENTVEAKPNDLEVTSGYDIADEIIYKFDEGNSSETVKYFVDILRGENAYEIIGNFNGDAKEKVNLADAIMMLQYIAKWKTVRADIDANPIRYHAGAAVSTAGGHGKLNTADVVKLLQYIAKWHGVIPGRGK